MTSPSDEAQAAFIRALRLDVIVGTKVYAERFATGPVDDVILDVDRQYAIDVPRVVYRTTYALSVKSEGTVLASLASTVDAVYVVDGQFTAEELDARAPAAIEMVGLSVHPYLRQSIAVLADSIGLPTTTVGLMRRGGFMPETVVVGEVGIVLRPDDDAESAPQ